MRLWCGYFRRNFQFVIAAGYYGIGILHPSAGIVCAEGHNESEFFLSFLGWLTFVIAGGYNRSIEARHSCLSS